ATRRRCPAARGSLRFSGLSGFARQAFVAALSCSAPKPRAHIRVRPLGGTGVHRTPVAFRLAPGLTGEWRPFFWFLFLGKQEKEPAARGRNPAFQTNRAKRTKLTHVHA
ncbi:hypothetical protein CAL65_03770, partial [Alkalilimnicola ehrlichii]